MQEKEYIDFVQPKRERKIIEKKRKRKTEENRIVYFYVMKETIKKMKKEKNKTLDGKKERE